MFKSRLRRPSPALVIAVVALFVAMGGTGYAAFKLPKNSVGSKQIKKNAVTGAKVKNRSLNASDFKVGQLPAGPAGPVGSTGAAGARGPDGAQGPAGTARAYARVTASGTLEAARTFKVNSVTHTNGTGIYCLELDPSIDSTSTAAAVTPYFAGATTNPGTPGNIAHVEFAGDCGTNGIVVETFRVIPGTTSVSGSTSNADQAFFAVIP